MLVLYFLPKKRTKILYIREKVCYNNSICEKIKKSEGKFMASFFHMNKSVPLPLEFINKYMINANATYVKVYLY